MWKPIEEILPILLVVFVLSQYAIPTILGTETWWLFKRVKKQSKSTESSSTLSDEIETTRIEADELKNRVGTIKSKVEENLKTAEDLKKSTEEII